MRKKKHGDERIAAVSHLLIEKPLTNEDGETPEKIDVRSCFSDPSKPVHLEIGCGKGRYSSEFAGQNPNVNLLALERYSDVACLALERAERLKDTRCDNLKFMIGDARMLDSWFEENSFDCIYLNFSDPWPKKGYAKRRLTHRGFLEIYRRILKDGGMLLFKTDNRELFDFSLSEFSEIGLNVEWVEYDLHNSEHANGNIMTEYEESFSSKGVPINACKVIFSK